MASAGSAGAAFVGGFSAFIFIGAAVAIVNGISQLTLGVSMTDWMAEKTSGFSFGGGSS